MTNFAMPCNITILSIQHGRPNNRNLPLESSLILGLELQITLIPFRPMFFDICTNCSAALLLSQLTLDSLTYTPTALAVNSRHSGTMAAELQNSCSILLDRNPSLINCLA